MTLRLLTYNAGLLSILGGRLEFAPFVEERGVYLPEQIRRIDADIVALQEVYRQKHREGIVSQLRDVYPFVIYSRQRRNWGLENGQMVLSKTPASGRLDLFNNSPPLERCFHNKGALLCDIETRDGYRLELVNLHTTAGGIWLHSEAPRANQIRARQIRQVLSTTESGSALRLIVGDLNAGPGRSQENFEQLSQAGYVSVYDLLHEGNEDYTWDPQNRLNRESPHKNYPPGRLDHVFVRKDDLQSGRLRPLASSICCREEVVPVKDGSKVTCSDHYGLQVDVQLLPSAS